MEALGRHLLLECYECNDEIINNVELVEFLMNEAAKEAKATIITSVFHPFFPHGISGVVVIAESHLTIHTWPEHRYAAIDVFTCGNKANPEKACQFLANKFQSKQSKLFEVKRGLEIHGRGSLKNKTEFKELLEQTDYSF